MGSCNIDIAYSSWEVKIVPANSPELYVDGSTCNGTTWFTQQNIYLSCDVPMYAVKRVIIHELTHAFIYATQMRTPDTLTEEEVCDFFGRWGSKIIELADYIFTQLYIE